jgi:hypothetical protein
VLDAWEQLFGLDAALTVNAVIASLADQPDRPTELNLSKEDEEKRAEEAPKRDALRAVLALVGSNRRGYLDPARLAYWLRQVKNRIVGGKRFTVPRNARSGAAMWAVSSAKAS